MPRSSKRIPTLADMLAARLKIAEIENAELKEHARKSLLKLRVTMDELKKIKNVDRSLSGAKKRASAVIRFVEHALKT